VKILVTGATGYLGAEVIQALLADPEARVVGWGRDARRLAAVAGRFAAHGTRLTLCRVDLFDALPVPSDVGAIVHCAAMRSVSSGVDEAALEHVNAEGTRALLESAASETRLRFVFVSSQSVYGTAGAPWREIDPARPETAYGRSKLAGERMVLAQPEGIDGIVVRLARLYGATPFVRWDELPGVFTRRAVEGKSLWIHGTGEARFELFHVRDAALAIASVVRRRRLSHDLYNLGCGGSVSVCELAKIVASIAVEQGLSEPQIRHKMDVPVDHRRLELCIDRVQADLGWRPRVALREGLDGYFDACAA